MKKLGLFLSTTILALTAISCSSSNKEAKEDEQASEVQTTGNDQTFWRLTDYVGADGSVNEVPADKGYILTSVKPENVILLNTDCNYIRGQYKTEGDSIYFYGLQSTKEECPQTKVEEAMKALLPHIDTYSISHNNVLRLRSDMRTMATFEKISKEEAFATLNDQEQ